MIAILSFRRAWLHVRSGLGRMVLSILAVALGVALVVATLVKMIDDNEFQTIWAWIGLALALAIMFLALIRVRYRWGIRGRDEPDDDVPRGASAPPPPLATRESREAPPE